MSQEQNGAPEGHSPEAPQEDEFFLGMQENGTETAPDGNVNAAAENPSNTDDAQARAGQEAGGDTLTMQQPVRAEPLPAVEVQPAQSLPPEEQKPAVPKVAIGEDIRDEWEELRKISPEAAALAEEDSPEGAAVRSRLGNHGFESAMDRADITLDRRKKADEVRQQEQRVVMEHNARFQTVLQREVPDIFAMIQDPARMQEAAQFTQELQAWIEGKPYAEATPLMEVYRHGRDPYQVASMIKLFQQERAAKAAPRQSASAENMMAVPGRGAPVAPSGVGDKDDFYAGLSLNQ